MRIGVLLSGGEPFSPYYGGAIARWAYEIYRRFPSSARATVFGAPTPDRDRYALPHASGSAWLLSRMLAKVPVLRRFEERAWLLGNRKELLLQDFLQVTNRPQWISILRDMGYTGPIALHLFNNHLGHWTAEMLDRLASQTDVVAVLTPFLGRTFEGRSKRIAAKTRIVPMGVDTTLFYPREENRERDSILFAGRFHEEKGVLPLVKAYGRVLESIPSAKLWIAGSTWFGNQTETPYIKEVRNIAKPLLERSPGSIRFLGYLHHDNELPAFFQQASVFACPSLFEEPFGMVNVEAMACATPVVGSNHGGIPDVLADTGVLVRPGDDRDLGQALIDILRDDPRRAELGRKALIRARSLFDWDKVSADWLSCLQGTLGRSHAPVESNPQ